MATRKKTAAEPVVTKSSSKVVVCLNLAHSLIFELGERKIKINGTNENLRGKSEGVLAVGKYGHTIIDSQDWDAIKEKYSSMAIFKNNLIFSANDTASANAKEKELKDMRHGLEPVDPSKTTSKADKE